MRNRSTLSQSITLAAILLHLGVVGVVPLADAVLVRIVSPHAGAHIEAEHEVPGPAGHNHLVCQLCRLTGSVLWVAPPMAAAAPAHGTTVYAAPFELHAPPESALRTALCPRAPPLA